MKKMDLEFIKKSGQEMYFDRELAKKMIERENNPSHILVSKIFEAILMAEFQEGEGQKLKIADLGAGAHPMRYEKFIKFLKENNGKIYWVDQSPFMLGYAQKETPGSFKNTFEYVNEEMADFLKIQKGEFDGLIFKYSFNYMIPCSLEEWTKIIYGSLKRGGKVIANQHFHEEGMKEKSYNAIFKIKGEKVITGYKPKDNEIIEIYFLQNPGDQSPNPEIFAKTKIVYYSPAYIKNAAQKAGFSKIEIYNNWEGNKKWKNFFEKFNPGLESKPKSFIFFQK